MTEATAVPDPAVDAPKVFSDRAQVILYPLASFGLLFVLWQWGVRAFGIPEYILPVPTEFLAKLWADRALISEHTLVTAKEIILGFLMAAGISIPLGFLIVSWKPLERAYHWYSFKVLPRLGQWVAGDGDSYRYLAESIRLHPTQDELKSMMKGAGFGHVDVHNLSAGVVALHVGIKC